MIKYLYVKYTCVGIDYLSNLQFFPTLMVWNSFNVLKAEVKINIVSKKE